MESGPQHSSSEDPFDEDGVQPTRRFGEQSHPGRSDDKTGVEAELRPLIGRYEITSKLGRGGFGNVYRARDPELNCDVAIKVPRPDRMLGPGEIERFRNEARTLARIRNHPAIVTVYDVGQTDEGIVFAVMEFVDGEPLSRYIAEQNLTADRSLHILMRIAEGLKAAHQAAIVHRDLKPSNVILDTTRENITLVDFGLALHDDLSLADLGSSIEGTPKYMAPEQIRGENHRIDGQTDIWAFGVIMYRMLTGKHPFRARDTRELARVIRYKDPKPLRQLQPELPREIERICLKCLSKMMADRYQSVSDLIEELSAAITIMQTPLDPGAESVTRRLQHLERVTDSGPGLPDSRPSGPSGQSGRSARTGPSGVSDPSQSRQLQITYKGLRPFDSNDRDFFLQLLPGPRNRDDIPESIQFWRSRILGDELEPLEVGLIYGPSGCGKSSFVRAGLLPQLPAQVNPVYLECTAESTERRLARQIAHRIHSVDGTDSLPDILRQFRRGEHLAEDDTLLIVLDQFEQWLHGNNAVSEQELTEALRQCDGERICCILLIRDDFWMSTSQFMKSLEIPIREGHNALALPLFDERHARKVLVAYGRAFDRLPASTDEHGSSLSNQQQRFIRDAVRSLSQNGKVICVHLSVFAQIAQDREWTGGELQRLGGLQGVGVRFLDDLFGSTAGSGHGDEQDEITKSILSQLLPVSRSDIKGASRTREALWNGLGSDYSRQSFDTVLNRLESEFRLVSAVDEGDLDEPATEHTEAFRLTHDFLVAPIRDWLERKQRDTWQGRARLRMEELGDRWAESRDRRFVPSPLEYTQVTLGVKKQQLGPNARSLLKASHRFYASWTGLAATVALVSTVIIWTLLDVSASRTAEAKYRSFLEVPAPGVSPLVDDIERYRRHIRTIILSQRDEELSSTAKTRQAMAGIICELDLPKFTRILAGQLAEMSAGDVFNVQLLFESHAGRNEFIEACKEVFENSASSKEHARIAIVTAALGDFDCLQEVVVLDRDLTDRTLLIGNFDELIFNKKLPYQILRSTTNKEIQATMLAIIAGQDFSSYENVAFEIRSMVEELFENSPDAAVHGCARLVACRNGWSLRHPPSPDGADWLEIPEFDLTFVRIPAGELLLNAGLPPESANYKPVERRSVKSFWICDHEISNQLFHQFLHDDAYTGLKPETTHFEQLANDRKPVQRLVLDDAKMFCNWLSEKTGRSRYYLRENEDWTINPSANGFRAPDLHELEYASRCGSGTALHLGELDVNPQIGLFENRRISGVDAPRFVRLEPRQKLPNYWGVHDSMGNSAELATDRENHQLLYSRGFIREVLAADFETLYWKDPETGKVNEFRQPNVGFRPALSGL